MEISGDNYSVEFLTDLEEIDKNDEDKTWEVAKLGFQHLKDNLQLCKHKKKNVSKITAATTKGNVFSIITGLALVGIGAAIGLACPPAGIVISSTGVSLITTALADEINKSCDEKNPDEKRPQNNHPNDIEYGGEISVGISI